MSDEGSCVTLIFYRINPKWWKEPALNLASAVCQMSNLTHVELSIGEETSNNGQTMKNVARVFNDSVGVELVERTGRNPQNLFVQLGCSKMAEQKMLHYVRMQCVGKPFSNYAMVRSLVWPRETDNTSFFCAGTQANAPLPRTLPLVPLLTRCCRVCAELVASILKVGGLLDGNCNPGAATPEMLHRIYSPRAAVAANPVLLRELNNGGGGGGGTSNGFIGNVTAGERMAEREALLPAYMRQGVAPYATGMPGVRQGPMALPAVPSAPVFQPARRRASSPPRGHFQSVNREYVPLGASSRPGGSGANACSSRCVTTGGLQLTMDSLKMGVGGGGGRCKVHPR